MNALDSALSAPWAMLEERVTELLAIAGREHEWTPEALEAYRAKTASNGERLKIRDDIAILDVSGPLFKRANLFTAFSGATSYDILRRDLQVALDDKAINGIILKIDSPGGEANGCDELAAAIYAARGIKPITSYVSGMACSGGYWLASAAPRIVISDLAVLGSIGVVLGISDRTKAEERDGITRHEFVSSQSPGKRPDLASDVGKARIQKMVDDLAEVFVSAVAKHRGVEPETVIKNFGAGGVEVGAKAVASGMADELGQFEATLASMSKRGATRRKPTSKGDIQMDDLKEGASAEAAAQAAKDATIATQTRIKAIMTCDLGKAFPTLAGHFAYDTAISAADATAAMTAAKADFDAAASKAPEPSQQEQFEKRKTEAGALGLSVPDKKGGEPGAYSWDDAVTETNAQRR